MNQPRVCQVVASINENIGGPAYSVTNLAKALLQNNISSHLFTLDYQLNGQQISVDSVKLHSHVARKVAVYMRGLQPSAGHYLTKLASTELDLIHNHGLWMFPNLYARQSAVHNRIPLIISPRGMVESWSLNNSWYKKWPAWILYEKQNLSSATAFHATSAEEVKSIRRLGYKQPIAFIPNGVSIPTINEQVNRQVLSKRFPEIAEKRWLLFLSRIHPKKGLDNLLYVWQSLANLFPEWHLIIAGADLIGYQTELELLIEKFKLRQQVTFTGMLSGHLKYSALTNADLFVLPTHSENFGIAIAESLTYGVPVITTKGAPWQELETHSCGWWIEDNQQSLAIALTEAMKMSTQERQQMGSRGRNLVQTKYSWNSVAKQVADFYYWILGNGEVPSCVQFYNY